MQNPSYVDTMPQTVGIPTLQPAVNSVARSRVEVLTQIGKAEPLWRELIQQGAILQPVSTLFLDVAVVGSYRQRYTSGTIYHRAQG